MRQKPGPAFAFVVTCASHCAPAGVSAFTEKEKSRKIEKSILTLSSSSSHYHHHPHSIIIIILTLSSSSSQQHHLPHVIIIILTPSSSSHPHSTADPLLLTEWASSGGSYFKKCVAQIGVMFRTSSSSRCCRNQQINPCCGLLL